MKLFLFSVVVCFILQACIGQEKQPERILFTVHRRSVELEAIPRMIEYWQGNLVCLLATGKLIVFDSSFKRNPLIDNGFAGIKADFMFKVHDSLFILTDRNVYYHINKKFRLATHGRSRISPIGEFYSDSLYDIDACCVGEWGGTVFFSNRKTNKKYAYFSTCLAQALPFKGNYVIANNLAHLGNSMSFLIVHKPETLYKMDDQTGSADCNWYVSVDSLKEYFETSPVGDKTFYRGPVSSQSLATFVQNDNLYSIVCNDSSVYVALHGKDTLTHYQTLSNTTLKFHYNKVVQADLRTICVYTTSYGPPFYGTTESENHSGFVSISDTDICFLKIKIDREKR